MSIPLSSTPAATPPRLSPDTGVVLVVTALFVTLPLLIAGAVSPRQAVLFLIGGLMGAALYHGAFGFTGGWRRMVQERRGRAMRAQMLMVAAATVVFIPVLGGLVPEVRAVGALAPVGVSVLVGAAMFGLGMQLGGGCGSGTLFTVGGGSARMLLTLAFFCIGALAGSAHLPWWLTLPSIGTVDLGKTLGVPGAILATLAFLGAVAAVTAVIERREHGALERVPSPPRRGLARLVHGPWPLVGVGLALAGLNIATLFVAGHPWSVTYGFGLWAAKAADALGAGVAEWPFWAAGGNARALNASVLQDVTSVMNFGIILGAALAAALAGRFAPRAALPWGSALAAVVGGLLMGYGARLSFGCNIGALFSGIASGSLHGWLWFGAAFCGSLVGIRARRLFGME
ncbi:YeeE/YedE family protein [Ruixingdingia sedimenti]|uniref:YeeE/YedE family protein n=1 Tax=Ruixingdingia sedimenti TaxID=3073604 RepID=A0ABU1FB94_9RHOB|nr:YeeE/YedE family protein [Xinfangfangia sp. LG-4]MDR5653672.1 YeeE/YedE family protein [Xinfangfangia sp. LG-4]